MKNALIFLAIKNKNKQDTLNWKIDKNYTLQDIKNTINFYLNSDFFLNSPTKFQDIFTSILKTQSFLTFPKILCFIYNCLLILTSSKGSLSSDNIVFIYKATKFKVVLSTFLSFFNSHFKSLKLQKSDNNPNHYNMKKNNFNTKEIDLFFRYFIDVVILIKTNKIVNFATSEILSSFLLQISELDDLNDIFKDRLNLSL